MTTTAATLPIADWKKTPVPLILAGLAFLVAFAEPMATLARDWWSNPEAGHGLLLFPVALWLGWKKGLVETPDPSPRLGMAMLVASVLLRFLSGLAAELFTMRLSLIGAAGGLIVYVLGMRQILRWWLPFLLILLSVPLPEVILGSLALPLQFRASRWGAALLTMRHVPVRLAGNVISLPGRSLFVTEACSGLRSLTALLALGILIGGLWLRSVTARVALIASAIPVAMALNAVRIFLTGFFVYFVDPKLAEGIMHLMEGWVMFLLAFIILAVMAVLLTRVEAMLMKKAPA